MLSGSNPISGAPRRWARRESTRLPLSRADAEPETRARWIHCYVVLLRDRLAALGADARASMDGRELLAEIFPVAHSLCAWVDAAEVCRLLAEEADCKLVTENILRAGLRHPIDHWARWWWEIRDPLAQIARTHRAAPLRILYESGFLEELRRAEAHLNLGDFRSSQAALSALSLARARLQSRWFCCEPRTREAAKIYISPVIASQDWRF